MSQFADGYYYVPIPPYATAWDLSKISTSRYKCVRERVAEHHNTAVGTLKRLATDAHYRVRRGVAKHRNTPVEVLMVLVEDRSSQVIFAALRNPNLPADVLTKVWQTRRAKTHYFKEAFAINPRTPVSILRELAKSPLYYWALKRNTNPDWAKWKVLL